MEQRKASLVPNVLSARHSARALAVPAAIDTQALRRTPSCASLVFAPSRSRRQPFTRSLELRAAASHRHCDRWGVQARSSNVQILEYRGSSVQMDTVSLG